MFSTLVLNWQFFLAVILIAAISYCIGSINFAIIITKFTANKDIRDYGSGNAGMTNVLRTQGKKPASVVLAGDYIKGVASVGIAYLISYLLIGAQDIRFGGYVAFIFVLLGHLFPVFYQFRGGKGILASAGALTVLNPIIFGAVLLTFIVVVLLSKMVSLASICAALMFPVSVYLLSLFINNSDVIFETAFGCVVAALVIFMHRKNIKRILSGTESKIGQKKDSLPMTDRNR